MVVKGRVRRPITKNSKTRNLRLHRGVSLIEKSERTAYLNRIEKIICRSCGEQGLANVEINRTKHTYGVYMKMKAKKSWR